jgi:ArsR family transcriptional regulator, arsenate/arsenite/antimonite-responsive transcriptional repressor
VRRLEKNYKVSVQILKALADETRIEIIEMISGGELCACKILESFDITQPTLSYHMKILTECGLVDARRDGPWMRYTINREAYRRLQSLFNDLDSKINQNQATDCGEKC